MCRLINSKASWPSFGCLQNWPDDLTVYKQVIHWYFTCWLLNLTSRGFVARASSWLIQITTSKFVCLIIIFKTTVKALSLCVFCNRDMWRWFVDKMTTCANFKRSWHSFCRKTKNVFISLIGHVLKNKQFVLWSPFHCNYMYKTMRIPQFFVLVHNVGILFFISS